MSQQMPDCDRKIIFKHKAELRFCLSGVLPGSLRIWAVHPDQFESLPPDSYRELIGTVITHSVRNDFTGLAVAARIAR